MFNGAVTIGWTVCVYGKVKMIGGYEMIKYCHGCGKELTDNDRMYELYCDVNCIDDEYCD